jgi:lipopolysaccharide transport system ATP-binding protein
MVRGADILVLSSHMPGVIETWCTRALWMDQGRVRMDGTPTEVLAAYGASSMAA